MPLTRYTMQAMLNHMFNDPAWTAPAVYLGLSSTTPTKDDATTWNVTEPSGGNYARVQILTTEMDAATDLDTPVKDNNTTITFAAANADWLAQANMTHFCLWDASSNGNLLAFGAITTPKPVYDGDQPSFAATEIAVSMT